MAKAKTTPSPKKGKATSKAKAATTPEPPLRRSPRKAVQSAKKAEAEEAAKVTKKASPAKKTSTVKKVANVLKKSTTTKKATKVAAPSGPPADEPESPPAKKATNAAKAKSPAPKKTAKAKTPSPKKAASPALAKAEAASPRPRGRPKKSASPAPTKAAAASPKPRGRPKKSASSAAIKPETASPKPRGRPPKDASPGKVTKKKDSFAPTHKRGGNQLGADLDGPSSDSEGDSGLEDLDGGGDNVDDTRSVEITGSRARSKSRTKAAPPFRKSSATRTRSRSQSPARATPPRRASGAGVRGRPQSPVKIPNGMSGSKARSQSPAKVVKPTSPRKGSATSARVRTKSPVKGGRKASPARNLWGPTPLQHNMSDTWNESIFNRNAENVFEVMPSLVSDNSRIEIAEDIETDPTTGENWFVETTRYTWRKGHVDALDVDALDAELSRRGAGAPEKVESKTSGHYDSRVGEELCTRTEKREWRRRPAEWTGEKSSARKAPQSKSPKRPTKAASRSPTKSPTKPSASSPISPIHKKAPPRSPSKSAPRRRSSEIRWDDKFATNDDQGKALRKLEMKAYVATKERKVFAGDSAYANDEDCARARRQGVERAKAEAALRELGSGREQRVREGYEERGVDLENGGEGGGGRRGSRAASRSPIRPSKLKPNASRRKSESTPPPPNSRRNSSVSKPGRKTSAALETSNPLAPGRPSAPDRGSVHSVTNPELIAGTKKKNPFFETMPGPEFWHREQPPYFMFGETPWMARQISRQIEADLVKGSGRNAAGKAPDRQQRSGSLAGLSKLLSPLLGRSQSAEPPSQAQQQQAARSSPFALPTVKDEDLDAAMRELVPDAGKKRRASGGASPARDPRRPRRMSGGNGSGSRSPPVYRMSGAL